MSLDVLKTMSQVEKFARLEGSDAMSATSLHELVEGGVDTVASTVTTHERGQVVSHVRNSSVASILSEQAAVSQQAYFISHYILTRPV